MFSNIIVIYDMKEEGKTWSCKESLGITLVHQRDWGCYNIESIWVVGGRFAIHELCFMMNNLGQMVGFFIEKATITFGEKS